MLNAQARVQPHMHIDWEDATTQIKSGIYGEKEGPGGKGGKIRSGANTRKARSLCSPPSKIAWLVGCV